MKLTALLILVASTQISAKAFSQETKVSLHLKDANLSKLFRAIEKKTDFRFVYSNNILPPDKKVSIDVKDTPLSDVLMAALSNTALTYSSLGDKLIVISVKNSVVQFRAITGTVTDDKGNPLIGVTVKVVGSNMATTTDQDGNYSIEVSGNEQLEFSYVGFNSQTIATSGKSVINLTMVANVSSLSDVVVVGYGTQKKSDITGSVVRVTTNKTTDLPNYNILQSLQGRVAGLNVTSPDRPGEEPGLLIRGINSISAGNKPLIVVDGIIYNGSLSDFNANDIASVDILKDASAAAVYGSRSANGVLLISTKTGSTNKPQFNFNTYQGIQKADHLIKVLDGPGYLQKVLDFREATGLTANPEDIDSYITVTEARNHKDGKTVNWMDSVIRKAVTSNYHLDVSGKTNSTNYYVSGTYFKQDGIVKNDNYKRVSLNLNLTNKITDWYSISVKSMFSSQDFSGRPASLSGAYRQSPYGDFFDPNGPGGYALLPVGDPIGIHPLTNTLIKNKDVRNTLWGLFSNVVDVPFINGLRWTLNFSGNLRNTKLYEFQDNKSSTDGIVANGIGTKNITESSDWTLDNILNYHKVFNSVHTLDATFLYSRENSRYDYSALNGRNFFTQATGYDDLSIAQLQQINSNYEDQNSVAIMGRVNYSFRNKYAITITTRRDGFSGFSQLNKYATFPSVALGWTASNEDILKKISWLNFLKVRLSYGKNGNQAVGRYQSLARMGSDNYLFDQTSVTTIYVNSMANNELTWETTETKNIGIDFNVVNQRISGSVDAYWSNTTNLLLQRALPRTSGFSTIFTNIGEVQNNGIEISLNSVNIKADESGFGWESGFVFSLNRNKIVHLTGEDANKDGIEDDDISNSWFIGEPLNSIYGYKINGIYQLNEDNIPAGFQPGDFRIADVNKDGKLSPDDRIILGNTLPNYSFSISNSLMFKNFGFYMLINSIQGGHNNSYVGNNNATRNVNSPFTTFTERFNIQDVPYWTPTRPSNDYPRVNYNPTLPHPILENRSFVRIQDVSVSYTFNKAIIGKNNNLRIYASAKNLHTFTKWTGYDPETATTITGFPLMRSYTIGLDFKF